MAPERTTVRLSEEARAGWLKIADAHGVTFTALVEAVGRVIAVQPLERAIPEQIITLARQIDIERHNRR